MDAITFVLGTVTLLNLGLAGIVLRAGPKREANRVFAAAAASVALWALTNALFRVAHSTSQGLWIAEVSYVSVLALAAAFLHFAWVYPRRPDWDMRREKLMVWVFATAVALLAFVPDFMVRGVDLESGRILTGPGLYLFAFYMVATSAVSFSTFYVHQMRLREREQTQARFVLYGSFLTAVLGLLFNLFLPLMGNYRFVWLGPACSVFFVGFTMYSIVAHELFDVRKLIRRTLAYSIVLTLLTVGFTVIEKIVEHAVSSLYGPQDSLTSQMFAVLIIGFAVEPVRKWAKGLARHLLFKGEKEVAD